jgi:hypothetical protein
LFTTATSYTLIFSNPGVVGHHLKIVVEYAPVLTGGDVAKITDPDGDTFTSRLGLSPGFGNQFAQIWETTISSTSIPQVTVGTVAGTNAYYTFVDGEEDSFPGTFNALSYGISSGDSCTTTSNSSLTVGANAFYWFVYSYQGGTGETYTGPSGYTNRASNFSLVMYDNFLTGAQAAYSVSMSDSGGAASVVCAVLTYGPPANVQTQIGGFLVGP